MFKVNCKCGVSFSLQNPAPKEEDFVCRRCYRKEQNKNADKNKGHFRVIGDVHGIYDQYAHLCAGADYSLQVGDMGFDYNYITRTVDSNKHKVIGGNHDNYSDKSILEDGSVVFGKQSKHFLRESGTWEVPGFGEIYFVRGAWSIDKDYRTPGLNWWPDEELTQSQGNKMLKDYENKKPNFVVTHSAPWTVLPYIPFKRFGTAGDIPTSTSTLLDLAYNIHQPDIWIFGHFHKSWDEFYAHPYTGKITRFICLDELEYMDFTKKEQ